MTKILKRQTGDLSFCKINKIDDLTIPEKDEQVRFITTSKINMVNYLDFIRANLIEHVEEIIISNSAIDARAIKEIERLSGDGFFNSLYMQINKTEEGRKPEIVKKFIDLQSDKITTKLDVVHAKVILIKTGARFLVLEGSGNMSTNAEIEQYCFLDSEESYNFHKKWIMEEKKDDSSLAFTTLITACTDSAQELFGATESQMKELNELIVFKFEEMMK